MRSLGNRACALAWTCRASPSPRTSPAGSNPSVRPGRSQSSRTAWPFLAARRSAARMARPGGQDKPSAGVAGAAGEAEGGSAEGFKIIKEDLVYSRYIQVFNRVVEQPLSRQPEANSEAKARNHVVEYDVVASKSKSCHFCCVFPYHSASKTVTLLKEYSQGANSMVYTVPCGGLSEAHGSVEECARRELSEEALLCGGTLIRLLDEDHPGLLEVKWCKNRFTPFLVIDPEPDPNPHPRDLEEFIEVHKVDIPKLRSLMFSGDMMLPSAITCTMALQRLQEEGLL